jgi:hypothetical protein
MSAQKRRPQPRKGRTAVAARTSRKRPDRALAAVGVAVLVIGVSLMFALKPAHSSTGLQLGDHWHAALGVYACDHWDGDASWATPFDPNTGQPVKVGTSTYAPMHSHHDGLIHMEPADSADTGSAASLGNYFRFNGFELSATHVKFATADLTNGDRCGNATGTLHWLVNGKERAGDPTKYLPHDGDWIVIAFLPHAKKITSLGKPPSFGHLATAGESPPPTETSVPTSTSS